MSRPAAAGLLALPALFLAALFAVPVGHLLAAADGTAWRWLGHGYARGVLAMTFLQAALSVAVTLAAALPLAWLHHRRAIPGGRHLLALAALPFVLPAFVVAFGVQAALGAGGWLDRLAGADLLGALGPLGAVVLANSLYNVGMVARIAHDTLGRRPWRLEEAARSLGASRGAAFLRVSAPLLAPPILAAALLAFLFSFSSFGIVLYLGQGEVETLETVLFAKLSGAFREPGQAAVLAVAQLGLQALALWVYFRLQRRGSRLPAAPARPVPAAGIPSRLAAVAATLLLLAPPLAVLAGSFQVGGEWSLRPWRTLADAGSPGHLPGFDLVQAIGWNLAYATGAALLAILLALLLGYGARLLGRRGRLAEAFAVLPLGTSSLVLGSGFLLAFPALHGWPPAARFATVLAVHTLVAFPFAARVILPALGSLDARLDEAAATLGASPWRRAAHLHAPLLRGPLAVASGFAAALSLGDFGASLLLMDGDVAGLAFWVERHGGPGAFDPLARAQSMALAGLLVLLTLAFLLAADRMRPHGRPR